MIILDTNVLSERFRSNPDAALRRWFDATPRSEVATTSVTVAEMRYGTARLPQGRRRVELEQAVDQLVTEFFGGRVEEFDLAAADEYGRLAAARERAGRPIETEDAMIAAICLSRGALLATRNTKDFENTGVTLLNPWDF
ncbi:type II toxin-antitoxin system VapC family toxin [Glycomyces niveus]|uniref:Ribonuclease VapC n=1 Tax=Glycomyces niveus TaxID=2820287 RepID=A0ABS3UC93_9ACTN|nr:type II toxin-antitoxin system VapC family toxin [Glycomyces sp. NEAU-S30]MBO3735378.1 type II toxin-antitoxin system VapC family toxin [Glycomyces sp. NEAU-S30]